MKLQLIIATCSLLFANYALAQDQKAPERKRTTVTNTEQEAPPRKAVMEKKDAPESSKKMQQQQGEPKRERKQPQLDTPNRKNEN